MKYCLSKDTLKESNKANYQSKYVCDIEKTNT